MYTKLRWSIYHYFWYFNKQEGHDGPEVAHLFIGPPPPTLQGQFNPRAFICTNLEDTHKKMFHAKHLSSSSLGFLKEDFF
jgi:hypothetical protein